MQIWFHCFTAPTLSVIPHYLQQKSQVIQGLDCPWLTSQTPLPSPNLQPHLLPFKPNLPSLLLNLCSTWASPSPALLGRQHPSSLGLFGRNWPLGTCCGCCVCSKSPQPWSPPGGAFRKTL